MTFKIILFTSIIVNYVICNSMNFIVLALQRGPILTVPTYNQGTRVLNEILEIKFMHSEY